MKSTLRTRIAAALLLSPFAALVSQPAQADLLDVLPSVIAQVALGQGQVYQGQVYGPAYPAHPGYGTYPGYEQPRHWRRDERAPRIVDMTPEPGDRTSDERRTLVSARFVDRASGIDPASVRLRINGQDVTHAARIDEDEIRYRERLAPGRYVADLVVRDRAGNVARRSWQFDVADRGPRDGHGHGDGYGYGYGRDRDWRR